MTTTKKDKKVMLRQLNLRPLPTKTQMIDYVTQ